MSEHIRTGKIVLNWNRLIVEMRNTATPGQAMNNVHLTAFIILDPALVEFKDSFLAMND